MSAALYPAFLRLNGVKVCVVGGGAVAERKIAALLEAKAVVRVVSPAVTEAIRRLSDDKRVEWVASPFEPSRLDGSLLAFAATDDRNANAAVADEARARNIWVNVADAPDESSVIVPATVRRGSLHIAVSTEGASPALGQRVRDEIAERYGVEYEAYCDLLAETRALAKETLNDQNARRRFFAAFLDSNALDVIRRSGVEPARRIVLELLASQRNESD